MNTQAMPSPRLRSVDKVETVGYDYQPIVIVTFKPPSIIHQISNYSDAIITSISMFNTIYFSSAGATTQWESILSLRINTILYFIISASEPVDMRNTIRYQNPSVILILPPDPWDGFPAFASVHLTDDGFYFPSLKVS